MLRKLFTTVMHGEVAMSLATVLNDELECAMRNPKTYFLNNRFMDSWYDYSSIA